MGNFLGTSTFKQNPYSEQLKNIWVERINTIEDDEVRNLLKQFPEEKFNMANQTSVDITRILISKNTKFSDLDNFLRMNLMSEPALLLFKLDDPSFIEFLKQAESEGKLAPLDELDDFKEQIRKLLIKRARTN